MKRFSLTNLFLRIISHYRKDYWLMVIAVALCAMVISGSLIIGDSVDHSLRKVSQHSIGHIKTILRADSCWLSQKTVDKSVAKAKIPSELMISATAYLVKVNGSGSQKINLYGINPGFGNCFNQATGPKLLPGEIAINKTLANGLDLKVGDQVVLRYFKPTGIPGDAPFSLQRNSIKTRSLKVAMLIPGEHGGDFSLNISQQLPLNGFLQFDFLAKLMERPGKGNLLVSTTETDLGDKLKPFLTLEDYGLALETDNNKTYLRSDSVFMPDYLADLFKAIATDSKEVFGYFVNSIESGEKSVPYSFVAGVDIELLASHSSKLPTVVINEWTARKLNAISGDRLKMSFYLPQAFGHLLEKDADFSLGKILPMEEAIHLARFSPVFPGMDAAESCSEWDPALPVDTSRIEADDEAYWEKYKSLPKAIVDFETAKKLWGNRFGGRTLLYGSFFSDLKKKLLSALTPDRIGLVSIPLAKQKLNAAHKAMDFRGLFLGLGFFVIIAALLLVKLLFEMHLERRFQEMAVMSVMGFSSGVLKKLLLQEALLICIVGAPIGVILGLIYAKIQIFLLGSVWQGALNFSSLDLNVRPLSLLIALAAAILISMAPVFLVIRRFLLSDQHQLISGSPDKFTPPKINLLYPTVFLGITFVTIQAIPNKDAVLELALFFIAGFALLYFLTQLSLSYLSSSIKDKSAMKLFDLAKRNSVRRFKRSQAVVRVLAFALFLIIGISANHKGEMGNPWQKSGGTGGFSIYGETAIPISGDLFSKKARQDLNLGDLASETIIAQIPIIEGSEASCFNLNSVKKPSIIGVKPEDFKGTFDFAWKLDENSDWEVLNKNFGDSKIIPVIADAEVIMWSLGLKQGSELEFRASNGEIYRLKFVAGLKGSIFQGMVLVSLDNFYGLWPESSGSRLFLANSSESNFNHDFNLLSQSLSRYGAQVQPAAQRLARFNRVQNTYLSMFLALGSIALLLGCAAIAILLNRNLLERKKELKTLSDIGYSSSQLFSLLFMEHLFLFLIGVLDGVLAAALAIYPVLASTQGQPPIKGMIIAVLALLLTGALSLYLSLRASLKEIL